MKRVFKHINTSACISLWSLVNDKWITSAEMFQSWYYFERPHSSVNSLPPADQTIPALNKRDSTDDIVCTTKLGGLLKTYSRRAAWSQILDFFADHCQTKLPVRIDIEKVIVFRLSATWRMLAYVSIWSKWKDSKQIWCYYRRIIFMQSICIPRPFSNQSSIRFAKYSRNRKKSS